MNQHDKMGASAPAFDMAPFRGEYPWQGHYLSVAGGARMHYLDEGAGEPLVMLHGNPTWSWYWRHLVSDLTPDYRAVVPDHIGCGLSDKPADQAYPYTLGQRLQDLETLIDHLHLGDNLTLIAHDWGGMIGLSYAVRHPERVKRLVLMNTAGFGLPEGSALPWQLKLARLAPFSELLIRGANAFVLGAARSCSVKPGVMTPLRRAAYAAPYSSWANRIAVKRFVDDIPLDSAHPSWDLLQEVSRKINLLRDTPTQLFWGEQDFVFNDDFLAEWRRRWPEADIRTFPDAGHYVLEDAHEAIVPALRGFLQRNPIRPSPMSEVS